MPGRLTEWKGQEIFIEALNDLKIKYGYKIQQKAYKLNLKLTTPLKSAPTFT